MSLITLCVASYNNANTLDKCIKSILNQTYKNFDLIIVDDFSSDNSRDILIKYRTENISVILNNANMGLSFTRNKALEFCKTKYLAFIDGDDYLFPNYVETLMSVIDHNKADVYVFGVEFISSSGEILSKTSKIFTPKVCKSFEVSKFNLASNFYSYFKLFNLSDSWNKLFSLEFITKNKLSFSIPNGLNGSDALFNISILLALPDVYTLNSKIYAHVIHNFSSVNRKNKKLYLTKQFIFLKFKEYCLERKLSILYKKYSSSFYLYGLLDSFSDIYNDTQGLYSQKKNFYYLYNIHKSFIKQHDLDLTSNFFSLPLSLFIFSILLNFKFITGLWLLVWLRKKFRS